MLVGSNVFFRKIEGFTSKDTDILELVDNPIGFKNVRQIKFKNKCVFQWRKMPINELIDMTLSRNFPMEIGKFLVPEFIELFNLSISDLKKLQPLVDGILKKDLNREGMEFFHTNKITVSGGEGVSWTLDGEFAEGKNVIEIQNVHNAVEFIVP